MKAVAPARLQCTADVELRLRATLMLAMLAPQLLERRRPGQIPEKSPVTTVGGAFMPARGETAKGSSGIVTLGLEGWCPSGVHWSDPHGLSAGEAFLSSQRGARRSRQGGQWDRHRVARPYRLEEGVQFRSLTLVRTAKRPACTLEAP